jgi:hypothetical protein
VEESQYREHLKRVIQDYQTRVSQIEADKRGKHSIRNVVTVDELPLAAVELKAGEI